MTAPSLGDGDRDGAGAEAPTAGPDVAEFDTAAVAVGALDGVPVDVVGLEHDETTRPSASTSANTHRDRRGCVTFR